MGAVGFSVAVVALLIAIGAGNDNPVGGFWFSVLSLVGAAVGVAGLAYALRGLLRR